MNTGFTTVYFIESYELGCAGACFLEQKLNIRLKPGRGFVNVLTSNRHDVERFIETVGAHNIREVNYEYSSLQ